MRLFVFLMLGACEVAPTPDSDCDPTSEATETEVSLWVDADEDGFTSDATEIVCAGTETPPGYQREASDPLDCDDASPAVFPGAPEVPDDGVDQDCDGVDLQLPVEGDVYVDSGDPDCQDETPGTIEAPNCSMEAGSPLLEPGGTMLVAGGEYTRERVLGGRTYRGGFDPATWTHHPDTHPSIIRQPEPEGTVMLVDALTLRTDATATGPTLVEDFTIRGARTSGMSVGFQLGNVENVTARRLDIDGGGEEIPDTASFAYSWGVWGMGRGGGVIEDSIIDGGDSPVACAAVQERGGRITIRNSVLKGCERAKDAAGLDLAAGEATLEDVEVAIDSVGAAKGVWIHGDSAAFTNGVTVAVDGDVSATGLLVSGGLARSEVKASAYRVALRGSPVAAAAVVEEGGRAVIGNSLFHAGTSTEGDASGVVVRTGGDLTLVNSLVDGGRSDTSSAALYVDNGTVTLAANDLWGPDQRYLLAGAFSTDRIEDVEACGWEGCESATRNASADPQFVDWAGGYLDLVATSPFVDYGLDPTPYGLVVDRDIAGRPAPADGDGVDGPEYDVGPTER